MAAVVEVVQESPREKRHRERNEYKAVLVDSLRKAGLHREADRVSKCLVKFNAYGCEHCDSPRARKAQPLHCMVRLCPHCEAARSRRLFPIARDIIRRMKWPAFMTLTIPNIQLGELSREHFKELRAAFGRLRGRVVWKKRVNGALYAFEVTFNRDSQGWHVHIHCVLDCKWWDQEGLARAWFEVLPGWAQDGILLANKGAKRSFWAITNIERIGPKRTGEGWDRDSAAAEVAKYMTKGVTYYDNPDAVAELLEATKGVRLWASVGAYYGEDSKLKKAWELEREPMCCPDCSFELTWIGTVHESCILDLEGSFFVQAGAWDELKVKFMSRSFAIFKGG